jgi:hypothetical protein
MYNRYHNTGPGQATQKYDGLLLASSYKTLMSRVYGFFGQKDYYGEIVQFEFETLDVTSCRAYTFDPCSPSSSKKNVEHSTVSLF